jgi:hypothetical protein
MGDEGDTVEVATRVVKGKEGGSSLPRKRRSHPRPQEHHTRNRAPIIPIPQRTPAILPQQPHRRRAIRPHHIRSMHRNDHGKS